ncbi:MAG TPA: hypothetical protein VFI65_10090 [Streptosporangiaceae bacterium]|nr:hypothetical protein [Streptosporangiaceae bacterium]
MSGIDFERRLEELLAGYVDQPLETGAAWRRFVARRRVAGVERARRLVAVSAAGAVAVAAVVLPNVWRHAGGDHGSAQSSAGRGLAISGRIAIPGRVHGPGDTGIVDAVAGVRGQVWVATYDGVLARIDPRGDRVTLRKHWDGLTALAAGAGAVWVLVTEPTPGITTGRLLKLDPSTGRVTARVDLVPSCQAISFGGGQLWAACSGESGGTHFKRFDPSTLRVLAHGGPAYSVSALAATPQGVWYVGHSGVSGFVGTGSRPTWVNASDQAGLADTNSLVYANGWVWAFDGGENVARISPVTGRITKVYSAGRFDPYDDLSLDFFAVDRDSIWFLRDVGHRGTAVLRVSLATGRPVGRVSGVGSCGEPCWQIYLAQGSAWVPTQTHLTRISLVTPPRRTGSR